MKGIKYEENVDFNRSPEFRLAMGLFPARYFLEETLEDEAFTGVTLLTASGWTRT
jgi:hypothetical protein